jgi:hypothetical protein
MTASERGQKMGLHRLRARLDRLEQVVIAAIGEDPEKKRQRFALLKDRKLSGATLTDAEKDEFERHEVFLREEGYRRHKLLLERKASGAALTDAETAELAVFDDSSRAKERDTARLESLTRQKWKGPLTDAEQNELAELEKRLFDNTINGQSLGFFMENGWFFSKAGC